MDNVQRVREFETLDQCDEFMKPLTPRPRDLHGRGGRRIVGARGVSGSKETASSKDHRTDAHMNSEYIAACTRHTQVQNRSSQSGEEGWTHNF